MDIQVELMVLLEGLRVKIRNSKPKSILIREQMKSINSNVGEVNYNHW